MGGPGKGRKEARAESRRTWHSDITGPPCCAPFMAGSGVGLPPFSSRGHFDPMEGPWDGWEVEMWEFWRDFFQTLVQDTLSLPAHKRVEGTLESS